MLPENAAGSLATRKSIPPGIDYLKEKPITIF
jgi:hypothetical protein